MEGYIEARRWLFATELLSLDFVRPVYGDLGLGVRFEESLRGILRDAFLGIYEPSSAPVAAGSPDCVIAAHHKNVVPALAKFGSVFGREQLERIHYWVHYVHGRDENPWEPYEDYLSNWGRVVRREGRDTIGLSADSNMIARDLKAATSAADIESLLRARRSAVLSDWDRPLFEKRGLLDIPAGSDYFPFVDEICLSVRMHRFQNYFCHLVPVLAPGDCDAIENAVLSASAAGRVFARISELPRAPA